MAVSPLMLSSGAIVPSSPLTPKQSPLALMPPSPTVVTMSPTRKESYKDLITRAISSHPDKLMTLSDIYAWIVANVEAYRDQSHIPSTQGWKNAIRHTLSFYKCFKRVKRHPSIEKPSYWTIDYSEPQTGGGGSSIAAPLPVAAKTSVSSSSSSSLSNSSGDRGATVINTTIARPIPTLATPVQAQALAAAAAAREEAVQAAAALEEQQAALATARGAHDVATSAGDLRAWASNWPLRTDTHASKEEQCIQGLLLFRTSGGFHFLPQQQPGVETSSTRSLVTSPLTSPLPKLPASVWATGIERGANVGDILTYTTCAQVYSRAAEPIESSQQFLQATPKYENGHGHGAGELQRPGASVTVVVNTLAGTRNPLTTTWTTASMRDSTLFQQSQEQLLKQQQQRRLPLQKRYIAESVAASSSSSLQIPSSSSGNGGGLQQLQQPPQHSPKPESVSYVQLIANAILDTPEKRATLAQIYEWLVANVAAFQGQGGSPSSVGWKNAVRHTLSTRPFFKRVICDEAFGRQKPAWWTVDVEAMNLASSFRQQHQSHLKSSKRRKNGHTSVQESVSAPLASGISPTESIPDRAMISVIHRVDDGSAMILEKCASEPPEPFRLALTTEETKWQLMEKEVVSSPEATTDRSTVVFRFPSTSAISGGSNGANTSTVSILKTEQISPLAVESHKYERTIGGGQESMVSTSRGVHNAMFETATGLDADVFECLLKDMTMFLDAISSSAGDLSARDALTLTLLRLQQRQQPSTLTTIVTPTGQREPDDSHHQRRQMRKLYVRWMSLAAEHLSPLIIWPDPDSIRLPPPYLTDRLIALERMIRPEHVMGVLDVYTMEVIFDHNDDCCRKTVNAVVVYNFDGVVIHRSQRLYWLGCARNATTFKAGLCSMIEDCVERELKSKLLTKANGGTGRTLLCYQNVDDILPRSVHLIRSRTVRNLLREKFGDRFSRFDMLSRPVMLKRKGSSPISTLASLDDALTICSGLLNLSAPVAWDDGE
jgi:hypothetical protein